MDSRILSITILILSSGNVGAQDISVGSVPVTMIRFDRPGDTGEKTRGNTRGPDTLYLIFNENYLIQGYIHSGDTLGPQRYTLYDLKSGDRFFCRVKENSVYFEERSTFEQWNKCKKAPVYHFRERDTILGYEVFRYADSQKRKAASAWHTDAFGVDLSLVYRYPGVPLSDYWFNLQVAEVTMGFLDKKYVDIGHLPSIYRIRGKPLNFGIHEFVVGKPLEKGEMLPSMEGRMADDAKLEIPWNNDRPQILFCLRYRKNLKAIASDLKMLVNHYGDKADLVMIAHSRRKDIREFIEEHNIEFPVIVNGAKFLAAYGHRTPAYFMIVDRDKLVHDVVYINKLGWHSVLKRSIEEVILSE